jgi:hypothetical protein
MPLAAWICADTGVEFLCRFWVENEIFFALVEDQPMSGATQARNRATGVGWRRSPTRSEPGLPPPPRRPPRSGWHGSIVLKRDLA